MNKKLIIVIVILVVAVGSGIALEAGRKSTTNSTPKTTTTNTTHMSNMPATPSATSSQTPAQTSNVIINNFAFNPSNILVKKGTTVTWTNRDGVAHTVTETDGQKGPDGGNLATGKTYSFTYDTAGTFRYHCTIHPAMTGTVTVTD